MFSNNNLTNPNFINMNNNNRMNSFDSYDSNYSGILKNNNKQQYSPSLSESSFSTNSSNMPNNDYLNGNINNKGSNGNINAMRIQSPNSVSNVNSPYKSIFEVEDDLNDLNYLNLNDSNNRN
ncbi:hypothetical protein BCR36DRAFT_32880 [Piromyces finnis]|nr:hypothetical protein BCR36DRAFT_32880 [Piromyces finnis]|eukprot:ORX36537.1 hypothetical protein BCR36DRAFT_32880 [Piromyces finnis]